MFIQSDLLRVVWSKFDGSASQIMKVHGTAFLLGDAGVFLTANHVLQEALRPNPDGWFPAVVGVDERGSLSAKIIEWEAAPNGQDVAIGRSSYAFNSWYRVGKKQHEVWEQVATAGYPEDAVVRDGANINIPLRAFKGIIQRVIRPGDLLLQPKTSGYELSFTPSPGVSGAPLFIYRTGYGEVIGVCVGAFRSERTEDEITEVNNDGSRYTEKRVRITQFGVAEGLHSLLDWTPKLLNGATLASSFGAQV